MKVEYKFLLWFFVLGKAVLLLSVYLFNQTTALTENHRDMVIAIIDQVSLQKNNTRNPGDTQLLIDKPSQLKAEIDYLFNFERFIKSNIRKALYPLALCLLVDALIVFLFIKAKSREVQ